MLLPMSLARPGDILGQRLEQLAGRIAASNEPPIAEIDGALQYLGIETLPIDKPNPSDQDKRAVELAVFALLIVTACDGHLKRDKKLDPSFLGAWPGIWSWLQLLSDQCCQQEKYGRSKRMESLIFISSALEIMSYSDVMRREMTSTPGVVSMVTRYWGFEGRYPVTDTIFAGAGVPRPFTAALNGLLNAADLSPNCLPDVITGAEGANAVATNALQHLNAVLAEDPPHFQTIYNHISLIHNLSRFRQPEILLAMLRQGMTSSVVKMLLWLAKQSPSSPVDEQAARDCLLMCFYALMHQMRTTNGSSWVAQALDAGILPAILESAPRMARLTKSAASCCSSLIFNYLSQYLIYKPVICSAARALRRVDRLKLADSSGGPIGEAWNMFKTLAEERIAFKEKVDQEEGKSQRCDHVHCGARLGHHDLLRCSGCRQARYCDKACQRMDWPYHKAVCKEGQRILRDQINIPMSSGEAKLLSDIVINDIYSNEESLEKLNAALSASPVHCSPSEFAFNLDYTKVPVEISVIPLQALRGVDGYWDVLIEEASQSNGSLMMARGQVQRGDMVARNVYITPVPLKRD